MSREKDRDRGDGGRGGSARVCGNDSTAQGGDGGEGVIARGGPGGDADVEGNNSMAVGGPGGRGGVIQGGSGGRAIVRGDNVICAGGEGGEANQPDGRGGRGGRTGYFVLGEPNYQLPDGRCIGQFGSGGDGGHTRQYAARLMVIEEILGHTISMHAASAGIREPDTNGAILNQINERLSRDQHAWRVRIAAGCFEFYERGKAPGEGVDAGGGEGGGGGEYVSVTLGPDDIGPDSGFHHIEFRVGKGGIGGPGEDTIVNLCDDNGHVLRSIVAKGGRAA
jgi:hypothetical protein